MDKLLKKRKTLNHFSFKIRLLLNAKLSTIVITVKHKCCSVNDNLPNVYFSWKLIIISAKAAICYQIEFITVVSSCNKLLLRCKKKLSFFFYCFWCRYCVAEFSLRLSTLLKDHLYKPFDVHICHFFLRLSLLTSEVSKFYSNNAAKSIQLN